jgi:precorrin-6B methylase 2
MSEGAGMGALERFLAEPPRLHSWDGGKTWVGGGFGPRTLRDLHATVLAEVGCGARIAETGAGASTIAFLLASPSRLVSVAPDEALFGRIRAYCADAGIADATLEPVAERSELALPRLSAELGPEGLDVAMIDGGHGWPTVFVDFCYFHASLRKGGLLIVDDVQLHSVKELARLLAKDERFARVASIGQGKTLVFRKESSLRFLPDFRAQPYILERTERDRDAGIGAALD